MRSVRTDRSGTYMYTLDPHTNIEDWADELVLAGSVKDPNLFVFIVRRYEAAFVRKARTVLRRPEDVEDVVQETFTKIYLHARHFKSVEGASFKSWGYRILMNTAFTKYRKVMKEQGAVAPLTPEHYEQLSDDAHEESFKLELSDYIVSILARMPETLARALELHFIQGVPQHQIAQREGVSVGAIKTRVHRAKQLFRDIAQEYSPY